MYWHSCGGCGAGLGGPLDSQRIPRVLQEIASRSRTNASNRFEFFVERAEVYFGFVGKVT